MRIKLWMIPIAIETKAQIQRMDPNGHRDRRNSLRFYSWDVSKSDAAGEIKIDYLTKLTYCVRRNAPLQRLALKHSAERGLFSAKFLYIYSINRHKYFSQIC
jgi:hypothetical protein